MGQVGLVLALEISRFARSQSDWYRVLELAAIFHTLIADEDGLYDPQEHNDRLLLGLKGTLSEAELWSIRARLQGGRWNWHARVSWPVCCRSAMSASLMAG